MNPPPPRDDDDNGENPTFPHLSNATNHNHHTNTTDTTTSTNTNTASSSSPKVTTIFWSVRKIMTVLLFLFMIVLQYCVYILQQQIQTLQQVQQNIDTSSSTVSTDTTDDLYSNDRNNTTVSIATSTSSHMSESIVNMMNHSEFVEIGRAHV